jgi:hypothetical protein
MNKLSFTLRKHGDVMTVRTLDTIRSPDCQCRETFPILYYQQRSIRQFVLLPRPAVYMKSWIGQTVPTQKNSMTRISAILLSCRFARLNMCHDPAHPVAKRITKAIRSKSIFSLSFMKREKRRHQCGQLRCLHLCLMSGLHGHMSLLKSVDGARIHCDFCTFSSGG